MTMRVLITGVNGFAGSQPAEYILAKRPQLHGMAPSTGSGQALRQAQDRPFDRLGTGSTN
ncbi:MAG: hypothetical protein ABIK79_15145 [Chloroflexota bacterium]